MNSKMSEITSERRVPERELRTADRKGKPVIIKARFSRHMQAYVIDFPQESDLEEIVVHGGGQEATSLLAYAMRNAREMESVKELAALVSQEAFQRAKIASEEEFEEIPPTLRPADVEAVRQKLNSGLQKSFD